LIDFTIRTVAIGSRIHKASNISPAQTKRNSYRLPRVSESQLVKTVERLTADGKYELAASLLESSGDRFARTAAVTNAKRLVYLKLMEKHQIRTRSNSHLLFKDRGTNAADAAPK